MRKLILDMNGNAHPLYARRAIGDVACEAIGSVPCQNIALTWYRDACSGSRCLAVPLKKKNNYDAKSRAVSTTTVVFFEDES